MSLEIERKYKIDKRTWNDFKLTHRSVDIYQGYLFLDTDSHVRVRIESTYTPQLGVFNKASVAYKKDINETMRTEIESEIDYELAKILMNKCRGQLRKERISIGKDGIRYDMDYFYDLDLYVCEVEFKDSNTAHWFHKPSWLGDEIVGDEKKR